LTPMGGGRRETGARIPLNVIASRGGNYVTPPVAVSVGSIQAAQLDK